MIHVPSGPETFMVFSLSSCFCIHDEVMSISDMVWYVEVGMRPGGISVPLENTFWNYMLGG